MELPSAVSTFHIVCAIKLVTGVRVVDVLLKIPNAVPWYPNANPSSVPISPTNCVVVAIPVENIAENLTIAPYPPLYLNLRTELTIN